MICDSCGAVTSQYEGPPGGCSSNHVPGVSSIGPSSAAAQAVPPSPLTRWKRRRSRAPPTSRTRATPRASRRTIAALRGPTSTAPRTVGPWGCGERTPGLGAGSRVSSAGTPEGGTSIGCSTATACQV